MTNISCTLSQSYLYCPFPSLFCIANCLTLKGQFHIKILMARHFTVIKKTDRKQRGLPTAMATPTFKGDDLLDLQSLILCLTLH